jgi:hypothetical protein
MAGRLSILLALLALAGCAGDGVRDYKSVGENNLSIDAKIQPNSFGSVRGSFLHVYEVNAQCKLVYVGTIALDKPKVDVGLPTGKLLFLRAEFVSRERFSESGTRNGYAYLLEPRAGYRYAADIRQQDRMYKFALTERAPGGARREIERRGLERCAEKS